MNLIIPMNHDAYSKFPTEESSRKPRSTNGGTLHDHTGCILFAFSYFYNAQTKLRWRLIILDGFLLFEDCELHGIALESLTCEVQAGDI